MIISPAKDPCRLVDPAGTVALAAAQIVEAI
jgi:hypothetical protein